jgi:tetratricopeptide (TPR) repeat protein
MKMRCPQNELTFFLSLFSASHFKATARNMDRLSLAVASLCNERYAESLAIFRSALKELLSWVGDEDETMEAKSQLAELKMVAVPVLSSRLEGKELHFDDHHAFSLYGSVLMVDRDTSVAVLSSSDDVNHLAAMILYNMGLIYHLMAVRSSKSRAVNFNKALRMYEHSAEVIEKSCNISFGQLLCLAVANNMAHVHAYFFNMSQVRRYVDIISSTLAGNSTVEEEHVHFRMNVVVTKGHNELAAAAA